MKFGRGGREEEREGELDRIESGEFGVDLAEKVLNGDNLGDFIYFFSRLFYIDVI